MITVEGVTFSYHNNSIINNTTFTIEQGDYVALTGINGSGKSTLLKLITGEIPLQEGRITLFGESIKSFSQWPRLGYLPQNATAGTVGFPANILEIVIANLYSKIGLFRLPGKKAKAKALSALASVGAADYAYYMPDELSGGQLQRVLLARALVNEPEILILDEPTTGIDAESVKELYQLLSGLHQEGLTIFMVTHDMARASALVSKTLCLEEGTIVPLTKKQIQLENAVKHTHSIKE